MSNFLHKMVALVLLVVGWAAGAWAQDASSTAVAELINSNGEVEETYSNFTNALTGLNGITEDGMTLKMLTDVTYTSFIDISNGKAFTFDLNGKRLSTTGSITLSSASKMTIVDNTGKGIFEIASYTYNLIVGQDCELNIIGGKYEFRQPISVKDNATLNICDGYFNVNFLSVTHYLLEEDYVDENAKINIYGGHYTKKNDFMTNRVAENYIVNYDNSTEETYKYSVSPDENQLIQITKSNGVIVGTYDNIQSAIDAITEDNLTLKIIKDIDGRKEKTGFVFDMGKSVTLDLNGKTLDYSLYSGSFLVAGSYAQSNLLNNVTIVDNNTGKGTVKLYSNNALADIVAIYGSIINIKGGTYELNKSYLDTYSKGKLNIYHGNFNNGWGTLTNGTNTAEITIYGGNFRTSHLDIIGHLAYGYYLYRRTEASTYNYYVDTYATELTYGDGTIDVQKEVSDNLTIDLKDEGDLSASLSKMRVGHDIKNVDVTVKKNFANTDWHAFYAPFQIDVTSDQNFEVAKIWDTELNRDNNSTLIEFILLKAGKSIPAFTPCLIKAKTTGKQDIEFKNVTVKATNTTTEPIECSNVDEKFTFTGVLENTSITGLYALDSETSTLVQASSATAKVTPMKFFMTVESKTPATSIKSKRFAVRVIGDETTGISDISAEAAAKSDGAVYNLQGVKMGISLNGLPAGLYIQNGRKVAVK